MRSYMNCEHVFFPFLQIKCHLIPIYYRERQTSLQPISPKLGNSFAIFQHNKSKKQILGSKHLIIHFFSLFYNKPISLFQPSSVKQHITQPQMTVGGASCDWEQSGKKNPHSLLFVGLKTSWTMWHQTFLGFVKNNCSGWQSGECLNTENTSCHSYQRKGGVYLTVQSVSSWMCDRVKFTRGMWPRKHVSVSSVQEEDPRQCWQHFFLRGPDWLRYSKQKETKCLKSTRNFLKKLWMCQCPYFCVK